MPPALRDDPDITAMLTEGRSHQATVHYLSYRAGFDEAGLGKMLDFSRAALDDRWRAGEEAMRTALQTIEASNPEQVTGSSIQERAACLKAPEGVRNKGCLAYA